MIGILTTPLKRASNCRREEILKVLLRSMFRGKRNNLIRKGNTNNTKYQEHEKRKHEDKRKLEM